jgi:hypothetical protein
VGPASSGPVRLIWTQECALPGLLTFAPQPEPQSPEATKASARLMLCSLQVSLVAQPFSSVPAESATQAAPAGPSPITPSFGRTLLSAREVNDDSTPRRETAREL